MTLSSTSALAAWRRVQPFVTAIAIAAIGGYLFNFLTLPLAWMMGAMAFTIVAAMSGVRIDVPTGIRKWVAPIMGVLIGSTLTPDTLTHLAGWGTTMAALAVWLILAAGVGYLWLRRVARYDAATAYFSAAPGGLAEMAIAGEQSGGDIRLISLIHTIRIVVTVFTVPIWFRLTHDLPAAPPGSQIGLLDLPLNDYFILGLCAVIGGWIGDRSRIPAGFLLGPMFLSAVVHMTGLATSRPPFALVAMAQIALGTIIGSRFVAFTWRQVTAAGGHALASVLAMLALTVIFGLGLAAVTPFPISLIVLAFAPAGGNEMSLMALSLNVDAAFVIGHQMARAMACTIIGPQIFILARRLWRPKEPK